jgi:hypothetical protein
LARNRYYSGLDDFGGNDLYIVCYSKTMTHAQIAVVLFKMKKTGEELALIGGELFSADELLSFLIGREITESEAQDFIVKKQ